MKLMRQREPLKDVQLLVSIIFVVSLKQEKEKTFFMNLKNLEKNNGPRRNIVADYHRCNLIILLLEN